MAQEKAALNKKLSLVMTINNLEGMMASLLEAVALARIQEVEYVLVDRASEDRTLSEAIGKIREMNLTAVTIQNGFGSAASALNTGRFRATGDYIKFVTPRFYGEKLKELFEGTIGSAGGQDMVLPVRESIVNAPVTMSGQAALELLLYNNGIPEFGAILFSRAFLDENRLQMTDASQMAGLGLELTIKAMARAGSVQLVPMEFTPVRIRKELLIPNRSEFSSFLRVDGVERALENVRRLPAIRPSIIDGLLYYYLPQKLMESIETLLEEGRGYTAIANYIRIHNYGRFLETRGIKNRPLRKKVSAWRRMPWRYKRNG